MRYVVRNIEIKQDQTSLGSVTLTSALPSFFSDETDPATRSIKSVSICYRYKQKVLTRSSFQGSLKHYNPTGTMQSIVTDGLPKFPTWWRVICIAETAWPWSQPLFLSNQYEILSKHTCGTPAYHPPSLFPPYFNWGTNSSPSEAVAAPMWTMRSRLWYEYSTRCHRKRIQVFSPQNFWNTAMRWAKYDALSPLWWPLQLEFPISKYVSVYLLETASSNLLVKSMDKNQYLG